MEKVLCHNGELVEGKQPILVCVIMIKELFEPFNNLLFLGSHALLLLLLAFIDEIIELESAVCINCYNLSFVCFEKVADTLTWAETSLNSHVWSETQLATITQLHEPDSEFGGSQRSCSKEAGTLGRGLISPEKVRL